MAETLVGSQLGAAEDGGFAVTEFVDVGSKDAVLDERFEESNGTLARLTDPSWAIGDENYTLLRTGGWLVAVVLPSCPYCKLLQSEWPSIVHNLSSNASLRFANDSSYNFAVVNAALNTRTASLLEVKAYPSIKLIIDSNVWTLREDASKQAIVEFVTQSWKQYPYYNVLPLTWSVWFQLQLSIFNQLFEWRVAAVQSIQPNGLNTVTSWTLAMAVVLATIAFPFGILWGIERGVAAVQRRARNIPDRL